jgi:cystathionine gamma-lyase
MSEEHFETRAIHSGQRPDPTTGAIMTPIYQTSTYVQSSPGVHKGFEYARTQNPTRSALEENLASLEGAAHGLCFASGLAAMNALMATFKAGDHFVVVDDVYGGTYRMFNRIWTKFGLEFSFVDLTKPGMLESSVRPNTKMIWIESPSNPLMKVFDISAISKFAKSKGILTLVDNTFASPFLQQPLNLGADLVLHSTTKYLGGHSDVVGGFIGTSKADLFAAIKFNQNSLGGVPGPWDCFLLLRSTKTLAVRMERHCENAQKIAEFLEKQPSVERVIYPGLPSHPQYALAKKQMKQPGGMISFVAKGGLTKARSILENCKIFALAESLGGVESLIESPAIMTHASVPAEVRSANGIVDGLIRISVGIENIADLTRDLEQAMR